MYGLIAAIIAIILFLAFTDKKGTYQESAPRAIPQDPRFIPPEGKIKAITKYLAQHPDDTEWRIKLAKVYADIGRFSEAIDALDSVLALQPDHQVALFNKGAIFLYDFKDRARAVKAWKALLSYYPDAKAPNGVPIKDMVAQVKVGMSFMPSSPSD